MKSSSHSHPSPAAAPSSPATVEAPRGARRSELDDAEDEALVPHVPKESLKSELMLFVSKLNVETAWLPEDYARLKQEVANIESIDLLKEIADKAMAMESFERARRENENAIRNLKRIVARLWKRMGELYKQKLLQGARSDLSAKAEKLGAFAEGRKHGHSHQQVEDAMALANIPEAQFEADLHCPMPSSKTALAKLGKKQKQTRAHQGPAIPKSDQIGRAHV